jgi:hypothetical protein
VRRMRSLRCSLSAREGVKVQPSVEYTDYFIQWYSFLCCGFPVSGSLLGLRTVGSTIIGYHRFYSRLYTLFLPYPVVALLSWQRADLPHNLVFLSLCSYPVG